MSKNYTFTSPKFNLDTSVCMNDDSFTKLPVSLVMGSFAQYKDHHSGQSVLS